MPSKLPQQFFKKPPVQSASDPYRAARLPTYLARISPGRFIVLQHHARGDQRDRRVHRAHRFGKFIVLEHVILQIGAAELPRAPGLVADVPELDVVRLGMAVLRALRAQTRV